MNPKANLQERLAQLKADFAQKLPDHILRITDLWGKLIHVNWSTDAFTLFHRMAHSLAGSAGTFGFHEIGETARKIDILCKQLEQSDAQPDAEQRQQITALTNALARISRQTEHQAPADHNLDAARESGSRARVFVVDDDPHTRSLLVTVIEHMGYSVEGFGDITSMQSALKNTLPSIIVMDIMLSEGSNAGIDAVGALKRDYGDAVKVVFISARSDMGARLKAVRIGGDAYLSKPVDANELALRLNELMQAAVTHEKRRILIVDDDDDFNASTEAALSAHGFTAHAITNPLQLMEPLTAFHPDLILLDLYMPHCDGFELVTLIRQHSEFAATPIVFLSGETDPDKQRDAIDAGGDDFLIKPVTPEHLISTVTNRLRRSRLLASKIQYMGSRDSTTGLYNRRYFYSRIMSVASAHTRKHPASLLLAKADNLANLSGKIHSQGADLIVTSIANDLRECFPGQTIIARLSDNTVGLLAPDLEPTKAAVHAESARKNIERRIFEFGDCSASTTCSIGITPVTGGLTRADEAIYAADVAVEIARTDGENRVHIHAPEENDNFAPDNDTRCVQSIGDALEKDRFTLVYQPIVTLGGDHDAKYNVFVRIHDDSGEELLPGRFIPVAERSHHMAAIDRRVLARAIQTIEERQHTEAQITLFVKVSAQSLVDPELPAFLESRLAAKQLDGHTLVLEIAEPAAKEQLKETKIFCERAKKMRCGIALQNFGSGLDSTQLLAHLPIDYIKLDGSFMHALWKNKANQESVKSITETARSHGILTIAEFVEDANSLAVLWQCGVNYTQGHFLAPASESMDYDFRHEAD